MVRRNNMVTWHGITEPSDRTDCADRGQERGSTRRDVSPRTHSSMQLTQGCDGRPDRVCRSHGHTVGQLYNVDCLRYKLGHIGLSCSVDDDPLV
eukprot:5155693-Prymnesium_polylepis.2